jgi:hypothetical protein
MRKSTSGVRAVKVTVKARGKVKVTVEVGKNRPKQKLLKFGNGNAKLDAAIFTFSLPAGHTCPFASACRSKADRVSGRITDGPHTQFRCFAASNEARARSVRDARWHNADALRTCRSVAEMVDLILASLSPYAGYVRVHVSGDFYSQDYFDAWMEVARRRPRTLFYGYTKSLTFWVRRLDAVPPNFVLTASYGGTHDHLIEEHGLRFAKVVFSEQEAAELGLELDHDDSHAMRPGPSFALLLHGTQPPGSPAAKALSALWAQGEFGHGTRADAARAKNGRQPLPVLS